MKVAVVSAVTPFGAGLHRDLTAGLVPALHRAGHEAEAVLVPCAAETEPAERRRLFEALALDNCDWVVALRPPAHLIRHERISVWLTAGPDPAWCQETDGAALRRAQRVFAATGPAAAAWSELAGRPVEVLPPPAPGPQGAGEAGTAWATADRLDALLAAMRLLTAPLRLHVETSGDPLVALRMRLHAARWPEQSASAAPEADVLVCLSADDDRAIPVMDRAADSGRGCIVAADCPAAQGRSAIAVDPSDPAVIAAALSRRGRSGAPASGLSERPSWADAVSALLPA